MGKGGQCGVKEEAGEEEEEEGEGERKKGGKGIQESIDEWEPDYIDFNGKRILSLLRFDRNPNKTPPYLTVFRGRARLVRTDRRPYTHNSWSFRGEIARNARRGGGIGGGAEGAEGAEGVRGRNLATRMDGCRRGKRGRRRRRIRNCMIKQ